MSILAYRKERPSTSALRGGFNDFDRMFDSMFRNALTNLSASGGTVTDLALRLDVSETPVAYLVHAELPGVEEKDIEVTLDDGLLTISGSKNTETEEDGKTFHRVERSYGSFRRTLALPADADENGIRARMKNGVLSVEIAKTKQSEKSAKRIEIESR